MIINLQRNQKLISALLITVITIFLFILFKDSILINLSKFIFFLNSHILTILNNINDNQNFLNEVLSFQIISISIAMPISNEIVSRISERYKSDIIMKNFTNHLEIKIFPYYFISNIILIISSKAGIIDYNSKIILFVLYILFLISTILLMLFFIRTLQYTAKINSLIERLSNEAKKSIN